MISVVVLLYPFQDFPLGSASLAQLYSGSNPTCPLDPSPLKPAATHLNPSHSPVVSLKAPFWAHSFSSCIPAQVVGILGSPAQTKESARRYVIYCVGLGHMFLLVGCGRGARPYVSIMCRWVICLYWLAVGVALGHMFLLCVCVCVYVCVYVYMYVCVYVYVYMCVYVCVCVIICFHRRLL